MQCRRLDHKANGRGVAEKRAMRFDPLLSKQGLARFVYRIKDANQEASTAVSPFLSPSHPKASVQCSTAQRLEQAADIRARCCFVVGERFSCIAHRSPPSPPFPPFPPAAAWPSRRCTPGRHVICPLQALLRYGHDAGPRCFGVGREAELSCFLHRNFDARVANGGRTTQSKYWVRSSKGARAHEWGCPLFGSVSFRVRPAHSLVRDWRTTTTRGCAPLWYKYLVQHSCCQRKWISVMLCDMHENPRHARMRRQVVKRDRRLPSC